MFKKKKKQARKLKFGVNLIITEKEEHANRCHDQSVSECSKTEPEAPVWSKVQQEVITPLSMYALSDVG